MDRIEAQRDDLVSLTQELIRIPTLNPPGECYREICEFLDALGLSVSMDLIHRICSRRWCALGDSDKYPRWNIVARKEGRHAGECVHFNSHTDVVEVGKGLDRGPIRWRCH